MLLRAAPHDLELDDGGVATPETLKEMALAAEAAARSVPGVTNSEGGSASIGRVTVPIDTSHGFEGGYSGTYYGTSASVIVGSGNGMQRDYRSDERSVGKECVNTCRFRCSPHN